MSEIPVGISACLLGAQVRHDGGHKHSRFCTGILAKHFSFKSVCPELEAGLGVPRPTIHLRQYDDGLRLTETKNGTDHTQRMRDWITGIMPELAHLRGYILMAKSPSCGMERIKVHNPEGNVIARDGRGLFADALIQAFPDMPVEEEGRLNDARLRENFIERVYAYDDWMTLRENGLTRGGLVDFHTRHKFQLLAHDEPTYRRLGPMIGDLKSAPLEDIADEYIREFMAAMSQKIKPGAHVNVMQHMMGFLRDALSDADRQMLMEQIEAYRREEVPLVVPMTLLRMAQRREPVDYLEKQQYLTPYPDELGLRNQV
ncbi:uncharacterized protein YbgA (DUF1722 family) [Tamilnaduibacter salinus]|uniref:Uncharacterized protein YbgA (DUF1722 family) n=1 Tax=Tamilnaduibacter salinus TaxID=1484056 RepID=A0A2A2I1A6_9GAMM|nr:DUF523 and DUF1722 domain-containing protein [Tamilnaduibacter salinus]PAV25811.1 hypothetical protein CF392_09165 [Tamilnaduibacter salinus]PVY75793.1 uncharacterized protein YbgA (DUF1722 family) [Tamilnaduibacter salinus]